MLQISSQLAATQLQQNIIHQSIASTDANIRYQLFYTLCKKEGQILPINNQRILLYEQTRQIVYYVNYNQDVICPFQKEEKIPQIKKQAVSLLACIFQRDPNNKSIVTVLYNKKKGKDVQSIQWRFQFCNATVAEKWDKFMKQEKIRAYIVNIMQLPPAGQLTDNKQQNGKPKDEKNRQKQDKPIQQQRPQQPKIEGASKKQNIKTQPENSKPRETLSPDQAQQKRKKREWLKKTDWNKKYKQQGAAAVYQQFIQYAATQFLEYLNTSGNTFNNQQPSILQLPNLTLCMADSSSTAANSFVRQFNNYNYIVRQTHANAINVRVPLTVLIHYRQVVCLAKAKLSGNAKIVDQKFIISRNPFASTLRALLKQFESCTKIDQSAVIQYSQIFNCSSEYGFFRGLPLLYINNLTQFLPSYPTSDPQQALSVTQFSSHVQVCPELIIDNFHRIIQIGESQTNRQLYYYSQQAIKELAQNLIQCETILYGIRDLEKIMKVYGLSMTMAYPLYYQICLKTKKQSLSYIKRLLSTTLASQIIMQQHIAPAIQLLRKESKNSIIELTVQSIIRKFCEGRSIINDHSWKEVAYSYRRRYHSSLALDQIHGGTLLACLMEMMLGTKFDVDRIVLAKELLVDGQIIEEGFVKQLGYFVESYSHLHSQQQQHLIALCLDSKINNISKISQLQLFKDVASGQSQLSQLNTPKLMAYLSNYYSPFQSSLPFLQSAIYKYVDVYPFDCYSCVIIINYLKFYFAQILDVYRNMTKGENVEEYIFKFQEFVSRMKKFGSYWLGFDHPFLSQILEEVDVEFHTKLRNNFALAIEHMMKSVQYWTRSCGKKSIPLALMQFKTGNMLVESGNFHQAEPYLLKSKQILQQRIDDNRIAYSKLLNTIATLELKKGKISESKIHAEQAAEMAKKNQINSFKHKQIAQQQKMQSIEILLNSYKLLCKIYELQHSYQKLRQLSFEIGELLRFEQRPHVFATILQQCISAIFIARVQNYDDGTILRKISHFKFQSLFSFEESKDKLRQLCLVTPLSSLLDKQYLQIGSKKCKVKQQDKNKYLRTLSKQYFRQPRQSRFLHNYVAWLKKRENNNHDFNISDDIKLKKPNINASMINSLLVNQHYNESFSSIQLDLCFCGHEQQNTEEQMVQITHMALRIKQGDIKFEQESFTFELLVIQLNSENREQMAIALYIV